MVSARNPAGLGRSQAERELSVTLNRLRRERGLSQRDLRRPLQVGSHTTIGDWESGRRLPPTAVLSAYEKHFKLPAGKLLALRERALAERSAARPARATAARPGPVPQQLPAAPAQFVGRHAPLAELERTLRDRNRAATVVISAIGGMAGIGKTALALHFGHHMAARFPDGQLYINMRGFDPSAPAVAPSAAIRHFLDAMGVNPARVPSQLDAQAALYRSMLAGRKVLILLDNVRSAEQVRPLLPGTASCLVLVTSRIQLPGLIARDSAHSIDLDVPGHDECRDLVASLIGADRAATEPLAVDEIVLRCGRLPLALAIVAARAATRPAVPLGHLAAELAENSGTMAALSIGDDSSADVTAVFSWSYRALSPPTARLFSLLGLLPGPDFALPAAASLAGLPGPDVRALLAELASAHMVGEHQPGRFALHDLMRAYARELADAFDPADRLAAVERMLDHYLHSAYAADHRIDPSRDLFPDITPARPGVTVETAGDFEAAKAWFGAERPAVVAAVELAARNGFDSHACQLSWALLTFLDRRGDWQEQVKVQRIGLAAAERLGDPRARARSHRCLADGYVELGRDEDALEHYQRSLILCEQIGDHAGQGLAHHSLAVVLGKQGRHAEALGSAKQALALYQRVGLRRGQARALNNIGWYLAQLGDFEQSISACEQALAMQQEFIDAPGQAATWDSLGNAHFQLGRHDRAVICCQRALDLIDKTGDRLPAAIVLDHLGDARQAGGDAVAASDAWRNALVILDDLDHDDAHSVRAKLTAVSGPCPGRVFARRCRE